VADARWHGEILLAPRGAGGFGYDPLFFVPDCGQTAAELAAEHKKPHQSSRPGDARAVTAPGRVALTPARPWA